MRHSDPRETVRWHVRWNDLTEGSGGEATLLDVSPRGVFVGLGLAGPAMIGKRMRLCFAAPDGGGNVEAIGVIRWVGCSMAHGTMGLGVEFDERCAAIEAYIHRPAPPLLPFQTSEAA